MNTKVWMCLAVAVFAAFFIFMSVRTGPWAVNDTIEQSFQLSLLDNTKRRNQAKIVELENLRAISFMRENSLLDLLQQHQASTNEPQKIALFDAMIQQVNERLQILERRTDEASVQ